MFLFALGITFLLGFGGMVFTVIAQESEENTGFSTTFSVPPFQVGEMVNGMDGWEVISNAAENPQTAMVDYLPNSDSQTGLRLSSYGVEKKTPRRLEGQVRLAAVLNFEELRGGHLMLIPILAHRVDIISLGYDARPDAPDNAGIICITQIPDELSEKLTPTQTRLIVPRADLVEGEPYVITADLDLDTQVMSLSVSGKKNGGGNLDVKVAGISFSGKWSTKWLSGLRVVGGGAPNAAPVLLESASVKALQ